MCETKLPKRNSYHLSFFKILVHFEFTCCSEQEVSFQEKVIKTNKSKLWNHFSFRGRPYIYEGNNRLFKVGLKFLRSKSQNSTSNIIQPQQLLKDQLRSSKNYHGSILFLPDKGNKDIG